MNNTDDIVKMLNHALKVDPEAIIAIFKQKVKGNGQINDDPYIEVSYDESISPIGIINGILNLLGENKVALCFEEGTNNLIGFVNYSETFPK